MKEWHFKPFHCPNYYRNINYTIECKLEEKINLYPEKKVLYNRDYRKTCNCLLMCIYFINIIVYQALHQALRINNT